MLAESSVPLHQVASGDANTSADRPSSRLTPFAEMLSFGSSGRLPDLPGVGNTLAGDWGGTVTAFPWPSPRRLVSHATAGFG
jgi:hypothetical protein